MTPKGHAIPSKTQLLSYGTPAFSGVAFMYAAFCCGNLKYYPERIERNMFFIGLFSDILRKKNREENNK